jgi:hypothetical protein
MTKSLVTTLVLVAAVACGGKKPAPAANRRPVATAPTSHKTTRSSGKSSKAGSTPKASKRTSAAKPDTANRNPLTNH